MFRDFEVKLVAAVDNYYLNILLVVDCNRNI